MTTEQKHTLAAKNKAKKPALELTGPAAPKVGTKRAAPDTDMYVRREDHEFIKNMFTKQMELTTLIANLAALAPAPAPVQAPPQKEESPKETRHPRAMIIDDESSKLVAEKLDAMLFKGPDISEPNFEQVMAAVEEAAGVTVTGEVLQPLSGFMARQRADESDGAFALRLAGFMRLCVHRGKITYPQHMRVNRYNAEFHLHLFRFFTLIEGVPDKLKVELLQDCRLRALRAYMKETLSEEEKSNMCSNQLMPLTEDTAAARKEIKELGAMLAWYYLSIKCYNNGAIVAKSNGRKPKTGIASILAAAAAEGDAPEEDTDKEDADKEEEK